MMYEQPTVDINIIVNIGHCLMSTIGSCYLIVFYGRMHQML